VGTRTDLLTAQIEETKRDLARNLTDLKIELGEVRRKAMIAAGIVVGVYVVWRLAMRFRRRG